MPESMLNTVANSPELISSTAQLIGDVVRHMVNISPFLGASGEVLAFTSIALEVPDEP